MLLDSGAIKNYPGNSNFRGVAAVQMMRRLRRKGSGISGQTVKTHKKTNKLSSPQNWRSSEIAQATYTELSTATYLDECC